MTPTQEIQLERENAKLRRKVARQRPFVTWVRMKARHALFCPRRTAVDQECTCGLAALDKKFR